MCGRFEIHSAIEIIARIFQIDDIAFDIRPSYNVAPGQDVLVIVNDGSNRLATCRWGFVPPWSKDLTTGYRMINARAETLAANRAFRPAFERRRCIVIADGFFEWDREKKPSYIRLRSGEPMGLAGICGDWTSPGGETVATCAIITVDANEAVAPLHDRMPAILPQDKYALWLDPDMRDTAVLRELLRPLPADQIELYPVTSRVNSYKNNDPGNIRPLDRALI